MSIGPLIYVLAFVVVVLLIQVIASTFFFINDRDKRVNRRLTMLQSGMGGDAVFSALVRKSSAPKAAGARLTSLHDRVDTYCRQAGLSVTPLRLLAIATVGAGVLWLVSLIVLHSAGGPGVLLDGTMSMVGSVVLSLGGTWFWINNRRNARMKKIEAQLPLALDIVNRAVRAGHPVVAAVQLAADEMGDPIGSEFGLIVDETTYGAEFKDALINFAHRTGSADAHFFAVAVSIQAETGGNLAEILEGLAGVIRARATLALRVNALASEGKASAMMLSILPVLMISVMMIFQPKFYTDKFTDPVFWPSAIVILIIYIIGQFWIRSIVNLKY